tara:strand:- start:1266 stop:2858 length:1593 start_codon:yes stop_codon:yes gene_type:complete
MGLPNRVLLNGDGRIVVGESGLPQVTNDGGGSCCCGCPEPFPVEISDAFTGLNATGDLFLTVENYKESPRVGAYPVGTPYTNEQLAFQDGQGQLVAFNDDAINVRGTKQVLMNSGMGSFIYPPNWTFNQSNNRFPRIEAPSQFNSSTHKSITTSCNILFGDDLVSHQQPLTNPDGDEEQMASGFPFIIGLRAMQTLSPRYSQSGSDKWREVEREVAVYIRDIAERETFGVTDWPYVEWTENHLKRVDFETFSNGDLSKTLYLPIESGDKFTIAAAFESYKVVTKFGSDYGEWKWCVCFKINDVEVWRQPHVISNPIDGTGVEFPPSQKFCEYRTNPYVQTYPLQRITIGNFPDWKNYYVGNLSPMVAGWDNLNVENSSDDLELDCGSINQPDPVIMQTFADATGRTIDPPAGDTPTPPPSISFALTYPYNWANISPITGVNFPAVVTGDTPVSPLTFSIESGSLPPSGLYLNTSTGTVTGTPVSNGSGTVSFRLTDADGNTATSPVYNWNVTGAGGGGGGGAGGGGMGGI